MSFFTLSNNESISQTKEFDMGGGNFEPIPDNTQLKVIIEDAKWDTYNDETYISLKWTVIDGEFSNRKIFQKLKVNEQDAKKADKAKTMLAAIDMNAGGQLMAAGVMPNDMSLSLNLCNKPMAIVVATWEINDKKGNWVKGVSPLVKGQSVVQGGANPQSSTQTKTMHVDFDADIGF